MKIEKLFHTLDKDQKGVLSVSEFKQACIYMLGFKPSKIEIERMLKASGRYMFSSLYLFLAHAHTPT